MGILHEQGHHLVGLPDQAHGAVSAAQLVGAFVERQVLKADDVRHVGVPPAEHGAYPRQQLLRVEGLGEVVVRTGVQAGHPVLDGVPGSQKQARGFQALCPQVPQHLYTVHPGHHPVQNDTVIGFGLRVAQRVLAVIHGVHLIAGTDQKRFHCVVQVTIILSK